MQCRRAEFPPKLDGREAARNFFAGCFADASQRLEHLWVAHFASDSSCLRVTHHSGDEVGVDFPFRAIMSDVAVYGSACLILAHNHPSGNALPSETDCRVTRRLASAAEALDCRILDHLIYAQGKVVSFKQIGLL